MYMMITSVLMALVLAINTIAILTSSNDGTQNEKRQATSVPAADIPKEIQLDIVLANTSLMTAMQPLADAQTAGKLGRFMGTPEALGSLQAMAKAMGATKTSGGKMMQYNLANFNGYGLAADPPEAKAIPRKQEVKSKLSSPGVKSIKIRYGPYKIPSSKTPNFLGQPGMLNNYPHVNFEKPCSGNCTIIGMRQDLEYPNGTIANIDSGLWLHHSVIFAIGEGRYDASCMQYDVSLPHVSVNTTAFQSERIFSNGNERTDAVFPDRGTKDVGYRIRPSDTFAALIELMNENPRDERLYFTMVWDILDGHPLPCEPTVVWHDVRNCGTSEANPPDNQSKFVLNSTWTSTIDADIIGVIGHVHDGGIQTTLHVDNQPACISAAEYGSKPGFVSTGSGGGHGHGGATAAHTSVGSSMKHVSNMGICSNGNGLGLKQVKRGQNWTLKAIYDFDKWPGMKGDDGKWDEVMGIDIMYIRKPKN